MSLHQLRAAQLQALENIEGLTGYDHVPARITVPAVVLQPGLPYLEAGDAYGTFEVRTIATLVADAGANDVVTQAMDDLIGDAVVALVNQGHAVSEVGPGYVYESNNGQFLAVDITILTPHRF